ncbi:MAG: pyridoxamine 5'-phosphate oxidase family protein [Gammaproteobacteria bacterium]|nr:pyridoxamine 5'-phosphate oxidase family protein [Gammaproteobacteria bacterium]
MKEDVVAFVKEHIVATVSTCDGLHSHGVPVFYIFVKDDNAFYFLTKNKTQKHINIEINNKTALTIFTESPPTVFTANCVAEVIDFTSGVHKEYITKLVTIHSSQECYPTPISTLIDGDLSLVKLNVENCKLRSYKNEIDLLGA